MPQSVAFICTGNICRSPMAEVVTRSMAAELGHELRIESFGTGSWHEGEGMDDRARAALVAAGYEDHGHQARGITAERLSGIDLLAVADGEHAAALRRFAGGAFADRVVLLRSFDGRAEDLDLADPYYGDDAGFATCLEQIEAAVPGLLAELTR